MNLIQTHRKVAKEVPGKPGIKIHTGEVVTPPVDDVTKYGPVDGDPIREKRFRMKQNVNLIQISTWYRRSRTKR